MLLAGLHPLSKHSLQQSLRRLNGSERGSRDLILSIYWRKATAMSASPARNAPVGFLCHG